jgi:hypothetical protein
MAFLPLCLVPIGDDVALDIRSIYMAQPDRVWRLSGGSVAVKESFRPVLQAYLEQYFGRAGDRWINPQTVVFMRYARQAMTLRYIERIRRADRKMNPEEFYKLVKLAGLTFAGWNTYVALNHAYLWSVKWNFLYAEGGQRKFAAGLARELPETLKNRGWVKMGANWINPGQVRLVRKGEIHFDNAMVASFGSVKSKDIRVYFNNPWAEINPDVHINLNLLGGSMMGKDGITLLLGNQLTIDAPSERARDVLARRRKLCTADSPRGSG